MIRLGQWSSMDVSRLNMVGMARRNFLANQIEKHILDTVERPEWGPIYGGGGSELGADWAQTWEKFRLVKKPQNNSQLL